MRKAAGAITTHIGNFDAEVEVTYRANQDFDNRGVFWDIDWDNVKVYYKGTDITETLGDEAWKHIETVIRKDLA